MDHAHLDHRVSTNTFGKTGRLRKKVALTLFTTLSEQWRLKGKPNFLILYGSSRYCIHAVKPFAQVQRGILT